MTKYEMAVEQLCKKLYKAVLNNYDEIIDGIEEPAISMLITDLEIPNNAPILPEGSFVDELFGDLKDIKEGFGLSLCFSKEYEDGCGSERVDEMDVEDLSINYLEELVEYAENHKGYKNKFGGE